MTLQRGYALAALAIFVVETIIALFVRDRFVRPYLGDVLAVMLVYCAIRAAVRVTVPAAAALALATGITVELGQYIGFVDRVGLGHSPIARTVFGTGFELWDFVAYAAGATIALAIEFAGGWRPVSGAAAPGSRRGG